MKIYIYYVTGTGNTKRAAELFQLQLNFMGHECQIFNWIHKEFISWDEADAFGFAFPVHAFREPSPFKKRLKKLPVVNSSIPVFIIASADGAEGNSFYRVGKILRKKGARIIATYPYYTRSNVLMWDNNIANSKKYDDPKKDHKMLYYAKNLPELIGKNDNIKIKGRWASGLMAAFTPDIGLRYLIRGKIKVDTSICTKCGLCERTCMAQCIILDPFPKINKKKCVACLGCINLCPVDALNAKNTVGQERYRGPGKLTIEPLT